MNFRKAITGSLITSLLVTQTLFAHTPALPALHPADLKPLRDRTVFHIQDIHAVPEAQASISSIVDSYIAKGGIDVLALEGAFRPINLSLFRNYPDSSALKETVDELLEAGEISGAVHAVLKTKTTEIPRVVGVDDARHHALNVDAFLTANTSRAADRQRLERLTINYWETGRTKISPELFELETARMAYHDGRMSVLHYVTYLSQFAPKIPSSCKQILQLHRVQSWLKSNTLTTSTTFQLALKYLKNRKQIDAFVLINDLEQLEATAAKSIAQTPEEHRWCDGLSHLRQVKKLIGFSLTAAEWNAYKQAHRRIVLPGLNLVPYETFYQEAEIRDDAMARKLLAALSTTRNKTAVLVTGGFHANGIGQKLKAAGITVVKIRPTLRAVPQNPASYLDTFLKSTDPLESLFPEETAFLGSSPHRALIKVPFLLAARPSPFSPKAVLRYFFGSVPTQIARANTSLTTIKIGVRKKGESPVTVRINADTNPRKPRLRGNRPSRRTLITVEGADPLILPAGGLPTMLPDLFGGAPMAEVGAISLPDRDSPSLLNVDMSAALAQCHRLTSPNQKKQKWTIPCRECSSQNPPM